MTGVVENALKQIELEARVETSHDLKMETGKNLLHRYRRKTLLQIIYAIKFTP